MAAGTVHHLTIAKPMAINTDPAYSVVIPLYNEALSLQAIVEEVTRVMNGLENPWELICVDDGSTDGTRALC